VEAKAREFHEHKSLLAGRESPSRDNTIDGNVSVEERAVAALVERDNGEAATGGQRPRTAFPKGFEALVRAFYWTYDRI
jgi:hypothetical protein